jgi:hypothetical protein
VIKIVLHTSKSFFVPAPHFPIDVPAHDLGRKYDGEYNREPGDPSCLERPFDLAHAHDLPTAPPTFTLTTMTTMTALA